MSDYELIDSGEGFKLERFGSYVLVRPAAQAAWKRRLSRAAWSKADASFDRSDGNRWQNRSALPERWVVTIEGIRLHLSATDFGHVGVFPEQSGQWSWIRRRAAAPCRVLNLFAYSGGSTLAAAQGGAEVCHLDASRGMVERAAENAELCGLAGAPIRWIVDDAIKFLGREAKRGRKYDGLILDPPSFGRGRRGEVFKIRDGIARLMELSERLLSDKPSFVLLTCHTPEYSPRVLGNLLASVKARFGGKLETGEMLLTGGPEVLPLPSGAYARWRTGAAEGGA
ncbi:MAG: class I SAM-dependent methyltransferase [Candidatus Eisenbacteria bacterium]|nr:class I SAM-dependent methyltransferase [Candidatus Eisenbacteria bacterium]